MAQLSINNYLLICTEDDQVKLKYFNFNRVFRKVQFLEILRDKYLFQQYIRKYFSETELTGPI